MGNSSPAQQTIPHTTYVSLPCIPILLNYLVKDRFVAIVYRYTQIVKYFSMMTFQRDELLALQQAKITFLASTKNLTEKSGICIVGT